MPDRLNSLDASFLYLEEPTTAMHVGSVMIFDPPEGGFQYDDLLKLIGARISDAPRYRQKVRELPGRLAAPVWVDAANFDLTYHVRRSALPRPGSEEQLEEFVGRIQSRPLDREHPLWEVYLVEGLSEGRFALVTKTHQAMVDGVHAVDIGHYLLDEKPDVSISGGHAWHAKREPSDAELLAAAALDTMFRPNLLIGAVRGNIAEVKHFGERVVGGMTGIVNAVARGATNPAPESPLNVTVGASRRFAMVHTDLTVFRAVKEAFSTGDPETDPTTHDVVLATIAGGLRTWLQTRGEPVHSASLIRAMVPVSVIDEAHTGMSSRVKPCFIDLPVGEANAGLRLEHIAYQMHQQLAGAIGAGQIAGLAGFAPPTLHHLGARLSSAMSRRLFNIVVTNVPGPQQPRYVGGARMRLSVPVVPLALGQAVAIGVTSYDGQVGIGVNGDRAAMFDLDLLADCLNDAVHELAATPHPDAPQ